MRTIQEELRRFFARTNSQSANQSRNTELIMYFYGLGDSAWPTLHQTAGRWNVTRERVRQIKNRYFRDRIGRLDIPAVREFLDLLETVPYWTQSDLIDRTLSRGLVEDGFSIRGLFNLINDIGLPMPYGIYTPDLRSVTRQSINAFEECFIMRTAEYKKAKSLLARAKKLSNKNGIARVDWLFESVEDRGESMRFFEKVVRSSGTGWIRSTQDGTWYSFEESANVLVTFGQKIFSTTDHCDITELAHSLRNALGRRKHEHPFPSIEVISTYLRSSSYFRTYGNVVTYAGPKDHRSSLPTIEVDLVDYLRRMDNGATYPEILQHLLQREHSRPNAKLTIYHSPLVRIDKREGRQNYRYFLVGAGRATSKEGKDADPRYRDYRERLLGVENTDVPNETTRRKEQDILREWLFADRTTHQCANMWQRVSRRRIGGSAQEGQEGV